jgi:hypothetical protein
LKQPGAGSSPADSANLFMLYGLDATQCNQQNQFVEDEVGSSADRNFDHSVDFVPGWLRATVYFQIKLMN